MAASAAASMKPGLVGAVPQLLQHPAAGAAGGWALRAKSPPAACRLRA